eukprot:1154015-Pelagomonas_calceolata.AAC.1
MKTAIHQRWASLCQGAACLYNNYLVHSNCAVARSCHPAHALISSCSHLVHSDCAVAGQCHPAHVVRPGGVPADIQDHVYAGMIGTLNVGNARRTSMVSVTMEAKDATMAGSFRTDAEQETATAKRSLLNHDTVHKFIMDAKDAILDASEKAEDATWAVRTKGNTITVDFYLMYPSNTSEQEIADDKAKVSSTSVLKSVQSSGSTLGDYGIDASSFKVADNNGGIVDDDAASALRSSLAALFAALAVLILVA